MNQLISETANEVGLTEKEVAEIIKYQSLCVKDGIYNGKTSKLPFLGKFVPKTKPVYSVINKINNANKTD